MYSRAESAAPWPLCRYRIVSSTRASIAVEMPEKREESPPACLTRWAVKHQGRLGSIKGSSARAPAEPGTRSVDKGPGPIRQHLSPFWRRLRKKDWPS
jgi:hypothetical protein